MSQLRELKKQTNVLLAGLGSGPDEVAASLQTAGVSGLPKNNRSCAIALYLSALMGPDPRVRSVAVGHCSLVIQLAALPDLRPAGRLLIQLPKPVRQFVAAFDARQYPMIVRQAATSTEASPAATG
jgi:hypothetical protein